MAFRVNQELSAMNVNCTITTVITSKVIAPASVYIASTLNFPFLFVEYTFSYKGECRPCKPKCNDVCPAIFDPICAVPVIPCGCSGPKQFNNKCLLDLHNCRNPTQRKCTLQIWWDHKNNLRWFIFYLQSTKFSTRDRVTKFMLDLSVGLLLVQIVKSKAKNWKELN